MHVVCYSPVCASNTQAKGALQVCIPQHRTEGAEWLISSSADGFINVMDLKDGLDEEEAFRVGPHCIRCRIIQGRISTCMIVEWMSLGRQHFDV